MGGTVPGLHPHAKFQYCGFENVGFKPQNCQIADFWYKFTPWRYIPLSNFYEIWCVEGSPRYTPSGQISPLWLYKCGLTTLKIAKNDNFGYKFAQKRYIPLSDCGLIAPKITKIGNFWYKFTQKGYTPLSDFYKIWLGVESPRSTPSYQISSFWL